MQKKARDKQRYKLELTELKFSFLFFFGLVSSLVDSLDLKLQIIRHKL